jgi:Na+/glutamate symporter
MNSNNRDDSCEKGDREDRKDSNAEENISKEISAFAICMVTAEMINSSIFECVPMKRALPVTLS